MALNTGTSIIDYLKSTGQSSDFATRKKLAEQNGISGYTGSGNQNTQLLGFLSGGAKSSPTQNSPANTTVDNEPTYGGGASGRFDDLTPEEADARAKMDEEAYGFNVPGSEIGDYYSDPTYRIPTLSGAESAGIASDFGFLGIGDKNQFAGLTRAEALKKAEDIKSGLQKNVSQNTSFAYNADFLNPTSSAKKVLGDYSIGLKDVMGDGWKTDQDKKEGANKLLEDTTSKFSELFQTPEDFDTLYSNNGEFKTLIDQYTKQGLSPSAIKSKIMSKLPSLPNTIDSLKSGNPLIDKILDPQTKTAESNIEYLQSIPAQYRNIYFGDEGYFTKIRKEAEDSVVQLNEAYKTVQKDTLDDLDIQSKKNEADANIRLAEIEETRATNKNYLNGMLAKLGALTTSGEAPVAISKLDAKYDQMSNATKTALMTAQSNIAREKSSSVAKLEAERLGKIATIKSDLNKSSFEIQKELLDVDQQTRKEINAIITDWQKQAGAINKSFIDKANSNKNQYEQLYFKIASGGLSQKFLQDLKKDQKITLKESQDAGVPYGTTYGQLEGKTVQNLGKPLTEAQAKDAGYAQRISDAEKVFSDPVAGEKELAKINPVYLGYLVASQEPKSGFLGNITNQVIYSKIPESIKLQFQAQRNLINTILRKESGAAIAQSEFDNAIRQYVPQSGDTPAILAKKKENRLAQYKTNLASLGQGGYEKYQNIEIPTDSGFSSQNTGGGTSGGFYDF